MSFYTTTDLDNNSTNRSTSQFRQPEPDKMMMSNLWRAMVMLLTLMFMLNGEPVVVALEQEQRRGATFIFSNITNADFSGWKVIIF
jgi:hypothetical protein